MALFLAYGQSNMYGTGNAGNDDYYHSRASHCHNWNPSTQAWEALSDPYGRYTASGTFAEGSQAPRLAEYLRENGYDSLGFVLVAQGATASGEFLPDSIDPRDPTTLFGDLIAQAEAALAAAPAGSYIAGMLINQGETDALFQTGGALWNTNWTTIVETAESELGVTLRTLVQMITPIIPSTGSYDQTEWDDLRAGQVAFAAARPNPGTDSLIVDSPPATLDNGLHQAVGADDTEGFRKLAVDSGALIVANWLP